MARESKSEKQNVSGMAARHENGIVIERSAIRNERRNDESISNTSSMKITKWHSISNNESEERKRGSIGEKKK